MIARFQYLTQDLPDISHSELARRACVAGVRWLQFRSKEREGVDLLREAQAVLAVCREFEAVCIINDHVELAKELSADGVHLGKGDMEISVARAILGSQAIVGGTANTVHDVERLIGEGVSYLGVGPFRFTSTKTNLSPVLGESGLRELQSAAAGRVPLIAIGGIQASDVAAIRSVGVHGVAASSSAHVCSSSSGMCNFLTETESDYALNCR